MTGQEWEDKFRQEHGRVARREEYRAAAARNFEPEEAPVEAAVVTPTTVVKKSAGKGKKVLYLLLAVVVAIVAGATTYKLTHSKTEDGTAKVASSTKAVSKASSNKSSSAVSSSSSASSSSASSASSTKASDFSGSTPGIVATDLSRTDRAGIIAQVIMANANKPATDVNGLTAGTVGGVGSGKGSLHIDTGNNGIGVQYSLTGDGGVSQISGRYSAGNGDGTHDFSVDVNDWLATHNLDAVRQAFGNVTVTDSDVSAMGN